MMCTRLIHLILIVTCTSLCLYKAQAYTSNAIVPEDKCIIVLHDRSADSRYWMGKTYSQMALNLLGHFPEWQAYAGPIEEYQAGMLNQCEAAIYIGSYFNNQIPSAFFTDLAGSQVSFLWMGYNLWQLPAEMQEQVFGVKYLSLSGLSDLKDKHGDPGFYRSFEYKGSTFTKYGKYSRAEKKEFIAAFEMTLIDIVDSSGTRVLSQARHSVTGHKTPYVTQKGNKFYLGDVPFSYIHEKDRYLIFADILFDLLREPPRRKERLALVRLEDIHPLIPMSYLWTARSVFDRQQIPMNISLIPIFYDPFFRYPRDRAQEMVGLDQVPEFIRFLKESMESGASLIWHGVTHQSGHFKNPHSAVSGDDFEFWDAVQNKPMTGDSASSALARLETGIFELHRAGLNPSVWLTPHYQASPVNYLLFGKMFEWNVGRAIYFNLHNFQSTAIDSLSLVRPFRLGESDQEKQQRRQAVSEMKAGVDYESPWSGQFYPYEIFGDVYGQRIIPENLGNSQPMENEHVVQPRSVEEMIEDARRNMVLRDVWGSFFYHVQLFNSDSHAGRGRFPGDTEELERLIRELKSMGYRFVSVDQFSRWERESRRPPIKELIWLELEK